ncbi:MAG: nuclear transport factor 2 family protein [Arenicellales bacterium]
MLAETANKIRQLFQSIDNQDTEAFLAFLADDVKFRFGNADPVAGKAAVTEAVSGFFSSVKSINHKLAETLDDNGVVICHGMVTYTRHDSTTLSVPFANILAIENALISDYRIFADISDLFGSS